MKKLAIVFLLLAARGFGQELPNTPSFWTKEKKAEVVAFAGAVTTDALTTQRGLRNGFHEQNPLMQPFVTRGAAGNTVGFGLGFGAGVGVVYMLHKTHHYKAERVAMRALLVIEVGVVANNIRNLERQ